MERSIEKSGVDDVAKDIMGLRVELAINTSDTVVNGNMFFEDVPFYRP